MNGRCDHLMGPAEEHLQFEFYPGESACQSGQVGERWNGKDFRFIGPRRTVDRSYQRRLVLQNDARWRGGRAPANLRRLAG